MKITKSTDSVHVCDHRFILSFSLNFISSPLLIIFNKWIYTKELMTSYSLVAIHFQITFLLLFACLGLGVFKFKQIDVLKVLPLAVTFCGFVVLTNLSLQYNTVGTSQLMKMLTTPCIVLIQFVCYNKSTNIYQQITMIPIAFGVFLNSYYDVKFNIPGITCALLGVIVTSVYQVWVGMKQQELDVDALQLLFYQAPISSFLMILPISLSTSLDKIPNIWISWSVLDWAIVFLSGVFAWLVNISIYWIIGNTSPVTYNMIGHLKFCVTIVTGCILFNDMPNVNQIAGVILTIIGVTAYTRLKINEHRGNGQSSKSCEKNNEE